MYICNVLCKSVKGDLSDLNKRLSPSHWIYDLSDLNEFKSWPLDLDLDLGSRLYWVVVLTHGIEPTIGFR